MATTKIIRLRTFNQKRLVEELAVILPTATSIVLRGHHVNPANRRVWVVNDAISHPADNQTPPMPVGHSLVHRDRKAKPPILISAAPGEIWIETPEELTAQQNAAINVALTAHDVTNKSIDQDEEDKDAVDVQVLRDQTGTVWNQRTNVEQNEWVRATTRLMRRKFGDRQA